MQLSEYLELCKTNIKGDPSFDDDQLEALYTWCVSNGDIHNQFLSIRKQYVIGNLTPKGFTEGVNAIVLSQRYKLARAEDSKRSSHASAFGASLMLVDYFTTGDYEL